MADTDINAGTLTVTITEALAVGHDVTADERDFAQTMTHTFLSIANVSKRILKLANTNLTKVATFGSAESVGTFKRTDVRYIRVTNLDGTDVLQVGLDDEDSDAAYTSLAPATSIIYTGTTVEGGNGGTTLDNATSLKVKGVAGHQVEVFIASV
jgi:hypothetical protein|tara:strand:- start:52789 stop:53250 length:462 start_codon:yes stop_codon:yes gene_type:complete